MKSVKKVFKNFNFSTENILAIIALIIIGVSIYKYSKNKNIFKLGLANNLNPSKNPTSSENTVTSLPVGNSQPNVYAPINGSTQPPVVNHASVKPTDLLPVNSASDFANQNPVVNNGLNGINLLNQPQKSINTVGSSLRNANLQIRSEPPNPRMNTNCPWNISTIDTDEHRRPLEIGSSA